MAQIIVKNVTDKIAKTGRPFKALEIESEGTAYKVNVFSNAPDFANIKVGSVLNGVLVKEGNFWNYFAEQEKRSYGASGGFKTAQSKEVIDYKDNKIGKRMDDKEFSIMVSSTMRDAVSLAIVEIKDITTLNTLEQDILKWRNWLLTNWEIDPKDLPPFN